MTHVIAQAPNRGDTILDDDGLMQFRFTQFLENVAEILSELNTVEVNTQDSNYTFVSSDVTNVVRKTANTASQHYDIPANDDATDVAAEFHIGSVINIQNDGTTSIQIRIDTDTLTSSAGLGTGTRTIAPSGEATILKVAATEWKISGEQIT